MWLYLQALVVAYEITCSRGKGLARNLVSHQSCEFVVQPPHGPRLLRVVDKVDSGKFGSQSRHPVVMEPNDLASLR